MQVCVGVFMKTLALNCVCKCVFKCVRMELERVPDHVKLNSM